MRTALHDGHGVLCTAGRGDLRHPVESAVRHGELVRLLPRVYSESEPQLATRARAVMTADPNAILTGRTAAALWWWADIQVPTVTAVSRLRSYSGYRFTRDRIPMDFVADAGGLRLTRPALTALDLVPELGGDPIDRVLRERRTTLAELWQALDATPNRPGNENRRRLLDDSRDAPWSEAERQAHLLLREAGIENFRTNHRVVTGAGTVYLDVAFPDLRLGLEIDGYEYHKGAFEADRWRDAALAACGWQIVRFPASAVFDEPARFVAAVQAILATVARGRR